VAESTKVQVSVPLKRKVRKAWLFLLCLLLSNQPIGVHTLNS